MIGQKLLLSYEAAANYPVHNVCPAFHCHTLEYGEHRQTEVVEICDAAVGAFPALFADQTRAVHVALYSTAARMNWVDSNLIWTATDSRR